MKRFIVIVCVLTMSGIWASAQKSEGGFHLAIDYLLAGDGYMNLNNTDFAASDFNLEVGYDFNKNFALFVPVTASVAKYNITTSKNYDDQTLLGLGAEYSIHPGNYIVMFSLSGSSTIFSQDQNFCVGKLMVKWGTSLIRATPTIGLGLIYNHPYGNASDRLMLGLSLGFRLL